MKNIAFTVAFGSKKYLRMARALKKSINKHSPKVEFRIYGEGDFTPFDIGLPKDRKLHRKDFRYPKIEIINKLNDPDTKYMFIDADSFVVGDITPFFDNLELNQIIIEYVYHGDNGWNNQPELQFTQACSKAGLSGIEPYSINGGFFMWHGYQKGFENAFIFLKRFTFEDPKGRHGEEYYYCAGLQKAKSNIKPLNYDEIKIGKMWGGRISFKNGKLISSRYPKNDRLIQHYGALNYCHPAVQKMLRNYNEGETNVFEHLKFFRYSIKYFIKKVFIFLLGFYRKLNSLLFISKKSL